MRKKALFIPCAFDGLSYSSGSIRLRAGWVCKYWDGADVYDKTQSMADYSLIVFQKAYLTGQTQGWIHDLARYREGGAKCKLAFDLCDPDFLSDEHRRRMLSVLPLFDFAVASTEPIRDWLQAYLPCAHIPDRVDLDDIEKVLTFRSHRHRPPLRLLWAGYVNNKKMLSPEFGAFAAENGHSLEVWALSQPVPFAEFWAKVQKYDVLLNPRPEIDPWRYKSNNKTLISHALGVPAVRTVAELAKLTASPETMARGAADRTNQAWSEHIYRSVAQWEILYQRWTQNG